jgi:hypothetical protein
MVSVATASPGCSWKLSALLAFAVCVLAGPPRAAASAAAVPSVRDLAHTIINETRPLSVARANRLPVIVWPLQGLTAESEAELESLLRRLNDRGIATVTPWDYAQKEQSLAAALRIAGVQRRLGLEVIVNSTRVMHQFFNGDESTAHLDAEGRPFFNQSFNPKIKIGCPFALAARATAIREQVAYFVRGYQDHRLPLDLVIADWEIDGPLEWHDAREDSRRCRRCRAVLGPSEDFASFQAAVRRVRSELQKSAYADVVRAAYPRALVGNYGVYPNDGYRYWYDYFEREVTAPPFKADQRARYRPWVQEFPLTGYTFAMPVVYTWYRTFAWYDFPNTDYRWFYNLLLVGTCAGRSTSPDIPLITFVHWHTTSPPKDPDPKVTQFSEANYQELLWHLLLRGHDAFALWCRRPETGQEARLVQEVYAASLEYREFLERGQPVAFDVPPQPGPVVSALRLGSRVLVRRTDFDGTDTPVVLRMGDRTLPVPRRHRQCQILTLEQ